MAGVLAEFDAAVRGRPPHPLPSGVRVERDGAVFRIVGRFRGFVQAIGRGFPGAVFGAPDSIGWLDCSGCESQYEAAATGAIIDCGSGSAFFLRRHMVGSSARSVRAMLTDARPSRGNQASRLRVRSAGNRLKSRSIVSSSVTP
jgi:hypothetical protein